MASVKKTVVIQLGENNIRLWYFHNTGSKAVFEDYQVFSVDYAVPQWHENVDFKNVSFDKSDVIAIIPRNQIIYRYLTLPSINDDEIRNMVDLQLPNLIPYRLDEVVINYSLIDKQDNGYSKVVVMGIPRDYLKGYLNRLEQLGIIAQVLTPDVSGINAWLKYSLKEKFASKKIGLIVFIEEESIYFVYSNGEQNLYSRQIRGDFRKAEGQEDFIRSQVILTHQQFDNEYQDNEVAFLIIVGRGIFAESMVHILKERFPIDPHLMDPLDSVKTSRQFKWPMIVNTKQVWPTLGLGIALNNKKDLMNFLPHEIRDKKFKAQYFEILFKVVFLLIMAVILLLGGIYAGQYKKRRVLSELDQRIVNVKEQLHDLELIQERVRGIKAYFQQRIIFPEVMYSILNGFPHSATLTSIELSQNQSIVLQGFAEYESDVQQIQQTMSRSRVLEEVNLDFLNKRRTKQGEQVYFKLTAQWRLDR